MVINFADGTGRSIMTRLGIGTLALGFCLCAMPASAQQDPQQPQDQQQQQQPQDQQQQQPQDQQPQQPDQPTTRIGASANRSDYPMTAIVPQMLSSRGQRTS